MISVGVIDARAEDVYSSLFNALFGRWNIQASHGIRTLGVEPTGGTSGDIDVDVGVGGSL